MSEKIALVTGANKGIGLETARQLAQKGIKVYIGARDEVRGKQAEQKLKDEGLDVKFLHLDVDNPETHKSAANTILEQYGKLDILVNNAAVSLDTQNSENRNISNVSETPIEIIKKTFDTNFFNLIQLTQTLLPLIKKSNAGRIVNVSSMLGSSTLHSNPESFIYHYKIPAYNISKSALNAFTTHLAYELKDTNIKVNAVHPGHVKTDMGGEQAPMEIEDGAKTSVYYATIDNNGPTGGFFFNQDRLPW